jgi:ABC-type transport system substrate-binding protein
VKFHDGSDFKADAVIWNLDKVLNDKAPQFDKRQSARAGAALVSGPDDDRAGVAIASTVLSDAHVAIALSDCCGAH